MKIQEIFQTIQGEGLYSGAICTFIRFAGCSLHCPECDTKHSWNCDSIPDVGVPYVLDAVSNLTPNPRHICITGGEPLEQPQNEIFSLLQALQEGYGRKALQSITIETNGSQDVTWLLDKPFRTITSLSVDYKLPSTGKHEQMLIDNFKQLNSKDVVKFVCRDEADAAYAKKVMNSLVSEVGCQPIMLFHGLGGEPSKWLADKVLSWSDFASRFDIRCNVQLHKLFDVR